jgi:hypothetical protein
LFQYFRKIFILFYYIYMPSSRVAHYDHELEQAIEETLSDYKLQQDTNTALYRSTFDTGRSPDVAAIPYVRAKPVVTVRPDDTAIQMLKRPQSPRSPPKSGFLTSIGARLRNSFSRSLNRPTDRSDSYRVYPEVTPPRYILSIYPKVTHPRSRTAKVSPAPDSSFTNLSTKGKGLIMRKSKRRRRRRKTRRRH